MKYLNKFILLALILISGVHLTAQEKKSLTFDDIVKWNRITEKAISDNGELVVYKLEPWKGDPVLKISAKDGEKLLSVTGGTHAEITEDSRFVVARIKPLQEKVRAMKLKKAKPEELPMDQLLIYEVEGEEKELRDQLVSFKVPAEWNGWIAWQAKSEIKQDSTQKDQKKETPENGYSLYVKALKGVEEDFPFVTDYVFAEEAKRIAFVSTGNEKDFDAGVYLYDLPSQDLKTIMQGEAKYKQLSISKDGALLAFVSDSTLKGEKKEFSLWLSEAGSAAREVVAPGNEVLPEDWTVSEHGEIRFAPSGERLFFGIAPIREDLDTNKLEEEIPVLDVWHWNEPVLHTVQLNNKEEDLKKSYLSVYHIEKERAVQLEKIHFTGSRLINEGDADYFLAWSKLPYSVRAMWEGYPYHHDFYLVDMENGAARMFKEDIRATPDASPDGNYIYWYQAIDTTWRSYSLKSEKEFILTQPEMVQVADEINDVPNLAFPYGTAGWLEDDEALLVYDRYDIWKVDPENREAPVNLTGNGRETQTSYRLLQYDREEASEKGLDANASYHLLGHNEESRADGYYEMKLNKAREPKALMSGKYRLNRPVKARDEEVYVYTQETFQQFPDLQLTENFRKSTQISRANPQQEEFKWGTVELYSWTSLDGRKLEGLLVKPEDFDPNKKYPMIVNFYEKSSQNIYGHRIPEAHRSTVDYHYYTSNDYIIFNPDVYYKTGYPGEDAFNCVMPGVTQLINEGFVDEDHIAAQGHSWGGYQVAYLATRTNLFAAIESGAPVVNMFSAYGGIRLWSGSNRSFQYEHTQSRIGKSIWESPLRYLENSPLFTADKIQTPMLIMHNENDGAVPVSQGVEFFIALRRMRKPAWLLNYNEGDHWPTKVRDKYDFQVRLAQFFDHFLKGEPMPKWMKEGIPAVDKGIDLGYELMKE